MSFIGYKVTLFLLNNLLLYKLFAILWLVLCFFVGFQVVYNMQKNILLVLHSTLVRTYHLKSNGKNCECRDGFSIQWYKAL
jgi:hypothetical protein